MVGYPKPALKKAMRSASAAVRWLVALTSAAALLTFLLPNTDKPFNNRRLGKPGGGTLLVVGAGPAGLALLGQLDELGVGRSRSLNGVTVRCYDRQPRSGGQWTGAQPFSGMYNGMWINNDRRYSEYPKYTYADHYGRPLSSYMPREVVHDYLIGFADKFGLERFIEHSVEVTKVAFDDSAKKWEVHTADVHPSTGVLATTPRPVERYDFVALGPGSFDKPRRISTPGFTGKELHAKFWAGPAGYQNQTVVVVGSSDSALDISLNLLKYGVNELHVSIRNYKGGGWRKIPARGNCVVYHGEGPPGESMRCVSYKGLNMHPKTVGAKGRDVRFVDGTTVRNVDTIIYATGYVSASSYGILADDDLRLRLTASPLNTYPQLYYDVVSMMNPRLFYLGATAALATFLEYESQGLYVASIATGMVPLLTAAELGAHAALRAAREARLRAERYAWTDGSMDDEAFEDDETLQYQGWRVHALLRMSNASAERTERSLHVLESMWHDDPREQLPGLKFSERALTCGPDPADRCGNRTYLTDFGGMRDREYPDVRTGKTTPSRPTRYTDQLDDSAVCFLDSAACKDRAGRAVDRSAVPAATDQGAGNPKQLEGGAAPQPSPRETRGSGVLPHFKRCRVSSRSCCKLPQRQPKPASCRKGCSVPACRLQA